ncbi:hypothetical protein Droror1_Dr00025488 [Drosera rotundifolia]
MLSFPIALSPHQPLRHRHPLSVIANPTPPRRRRRRFPRFQAIIAKSLDNDSQVVEDELIAKALQESMNLASPARNVPENIIDPYPFFFNSVLRFNDDVSRCFPSVVQGSQVLHLHHRQHRHPHQHRLLALDHRRSRINIALAHNQQLTNFNQELDMKKTSSLIVLLS